MFPGTDGSYSTDVGTDIDWTGAGGGATSDFLHSLNQQRYWSDLSQAYQFTGGTASYANELISELASWSAAFPTVTAPTAWSKNDQRLAAGQRDPRRAMVLVVLSTARQQRVDRRGEHAVPLQDATAGRVPRHHAELRQHRQPPALPRRRLARRGRLVSGIQRRQCERRRGSSGGTISTARITTTARITSNRPATRRRSRSCSEDGIPRFEKRLHLGRIARPEAHGRGERDLSVPHARRQSPGAGRHVSHRIGRHVSHGRRDPGREHLAGGETAGCAMRGSLVSRRRRRTWATTSTPRPARARPAFRCPTAATTSCAGPTREPTRASSSSTPAPRAATTATTTR